MTTVYKMNQHIKSLERVITRQEKNVAPYNECVSDGENSGLLAFNEKVKIM